MAKNVSLFSGENLAFLAKFFYPWGIACPSSQATSWSIRKFDLPRTGDVR